MNVLKRLKNEAKMLEYHHFYNSALNWTNDNRYYFGIL